MRVVVLFPSAKQAHPGGTCRTNVLLPRQQEVAPRLDALRMLSHACICHAADSALSGVQGAVTSAVATKIASFCAIVASEWVVSTTFNW